MAFDEATAINQIATYEAAISGVKTVYGYSQNPDHLNNADLPAVVHYVAEFTLTPRAHFNVWRTDMRFTSILFVGPREAQGGKLKFIENDAIPFGQLWRNQFETGATITNLLSSLGAVKAFLQSGKYGAGGPLLTYNGIEFIGWVFTFDLSA